MLRDAGRRPRSAPLLTFEIPAPTRMSDLRWLEPYPDDRLGWVADSQPGPAARYESREAIELAFITALLGDATQRTGPPHPASIEEQKLVEQFASAFLADDIDGMVALVTQNAWFRMPPTQHEYHGPALIGAFLAAVSKGHLGQLSRLIATRANGKPAFGTYYIDSLSGSVQQSGLLVMSLAGAGVSELTWFLGPDYLQRFDLPSAPFVDAPVSKAL